MAGVEVVAMPPVSDGDATHRPISAAYYRVSPKLYLEKVGTKWMQVTGAARPGITYTLDQLPDGYEVWEKRRATGNLTDRWLFGHPRRQKFDSPNRFFPHFFHLVTAGNNQGCPCDLCKKERLGRPASGASGAGPVASAGAPVVRVPPAANVYDELLATLAEKGTVRADVAEPRDGEWIADRQMLPGAVRAARGLPPWAPRPGEVVLFVRRLDADREIGFDEHTHRYRVWDRATGDVVGDPGWRAGVVTQAAEEALSVDDLLREASAKRFERNYAGFRVETLPDPTGRDASLSKQYAYVPLHQVRPFAFWAEFLGGVPEASWHASIRHACRAMATVSLLDRRRVEGAWPEARVYCGGLYVGAELVLLGDLVRIARPGETRDAGTDALRVDAVRVTIAGRDRGGPDRSTRVDRISVELLGPAWTTDGRRAWKGDGDDPPADLEGYDDQFQLVARPGVMVCVPFSHVVGRCVGAEAQQLWLPPPPSAGVDAAPSLGAGTSGVVSARAYAAQNDSRLAGSGRGWFWADYRSEALGLRTVNGFDLPLFESDEARRARPLAARSSLGGARAGHSSLIRTGLEAAADQDAAEIGDDVDMETGTTRKRSRSMAEATTGRGGSSGSGTIPMDEDDDLGDEDEIMDAVGEFAEGRAFDDTAWEHRATKYR